MGYLLYKLEFPNGIHIGNANSVGLEETTLTVHSDTFFSALYSEYMKIYGDNELLEMIEKNEFLISDLLPFKNISKYETSFYLSKPFVNIDRKTQNDNEQKIDRKKVKALSYIPASRLGEYFSFLEKGENFPEIDEDFGEKQLYTKNKISRIGEDTEIYNVEVFKFNEKSGLYFIVKVPKNWKEKFDNVLESLSLTGIGGKKTSGYGQFNILDLEGIKDDAVYLQKRLGIESDRYLLLSSYAPKKDEIEKLKNNNNCYQLIKRSGFVNNSSYSENPQKRKQVYMISSGATLDFKPEGRIVDLKLHGKHSIYRMGKPIVIGVELWGK